MEPEEIYVPPTIEEEDRIKFGKWRRTTYKDIVSNQQLGFADYEGDYQLMELIEPI